MSDTWNALKDVADERQKLTLSKAADAAKEVGRLMDQEIAKAQSNREFSAALSELGIKAADTERKEREGRAEGRRDQERLDLDRERSGETERHNRQQEKTDRGELRRKRKADEKSKEKKEKPKSFTPEQRRSNRRLLRRAISLVNGYGFRVGSGGRAYTLLREDLGEKFDPLLAEAAILMAFYRRLDPARDREFRRQYGFFAKNYRG